MKNKNILFFTFFLVLLNGCVQNTALIGPAITVATTGNVYQAGITYGTNEAFKRETGKNALNYVNEIVELSNNKKTKIDEDFIVLVETRINKTRKKLIKQNSTLIN